MTADQVKGKGFKGALSYNLNKVEREVAKVLTSTFTKDDDLKVMLREVNMVRMQRPNLARYFYHTSLNFPKHEALPDEQMKTIAGDYLDQMGFGDNQHIIFRHFDADHPHLHILANRIGYDGNVVSDSKDYQRSEQVLRLLEKQYGLTEVISSKQAQERAMTKNEMEMMEHTKKPSAKMKLQVLVKDAKDNSSNLKTFISQLEQHGINVLFNQASTGFVSGISYGYEGMRFKGAHLGNAYKWQAVKTATGYEQERDSTAVREANLRTRSLSEERAKLRETGRTTGRSTRVDEQHKGIRADAVPAQSDTDALQWRDGQLSEGNQGQRSGKEPVQAQGAERNSNEHGQSLEHDSGWRREVSQSTEQDRQQMGHEALPHSDLIGNLLGTINAGDSMASVELNQNHKKRKKKRRGLSH